MEDKFENKVGQVRDSCEGIEILRGETKEGDCVF